MRSLILASSLLAVTVPLASLAADTEKTQFMSHKAIMGLIAKAKADRKGNAPMVPEPILQLAPYRAQLEYRPATAPAAVHEKDAELFVVLEGKGNILTGGKLVDEKRVNANNLSGSSISDGEAHNVVVGDVLMVPANTPHQVIPAGGKPIVVMTMHVPYPPENWPPKN